MLYSNNSYAQVVFVAFASLALGLSVSPDSALQTTSCTAPNCEHMHLFMACIQSLSFPKSTAPSPLPNHHGFLTICSYI